MKKGGYEPDSTRGSPRGGVLRWGLALAVMAGLALFAFQLGCGGVGIWIGLADGLVVVAIVMIRRWTMRARLGLVGV